MITLRLLLFVAVLFATQVPNLAAHGPGQHVLGTVTGITGTRPEIDKIIAAWKVYSEKVPGADGDYIMNHTASVFLINSQGGFEGTIAYGESQDTAVGKLKKLIAKG